jgi:hypothetical protein
MPSDVLVSLFTGREAAAHRRRKARASWALAGALALALAPMAGVADGTSSLPPGHPPIGGERLPPGHPPIPGGDASACSPDLPQGHPPVRDPRVPEGHPAVEVRPCAPGAASRGALRPDVIPVPMFSDAGLTET